MCLDGYIEDSLVASLDPSTTSRARLAIDSQFRKNKLRVHEVTETSTDESFLGLELDGSQGVLRPSRKRVWKLYQAVTHLLSKPYIYLQDFVGYTRTLHFSFVL